MILSGRRAHNSKPHQVIPECIEDDTIVCRPLVAVIQDVSLKGSFPALHISAHQSDSAISEDNSGFPNRSIPLASPVAAVK